MPNQDSQTTHDGAVSDDRRATVFAVMPPPTTGMTLCTELIAKRLGARGRVRVLNLSDGSARITLGFRLAKLLRTFGAITKLTLGASRGGPLYMSINARRAMWYNIAAAAAARLWGSPVAAHHHIYAYITRPDWRVKLLDRVMGPRGLHLVLCDHMRDELSRLYGLQAPFMSLPSTVMMTGDQPRPDPDDAEVYRGQREFRVGHLANLSHDKGIDHVFNLFESLQGEHSSVRLVLAGPVMDSEAEHRLDRARQEYPDRLDYRGPVYGEDKELFFQDIDVLLLPSRFDAQPVVISEAFERGKPVIALGWSCIPGLIGANKEWNVCPQSDYVTHAKRVIDAWLANPGGYAADAVRAFEQAEALHTDAQAASARFLEWAHQQASSA